MGQAQLVFFSESGFTERYARWLHETTSIPCCRLDNRMSTNVGAPDDLLVIGSPVHGGELAKRKALNRLIGLAGEARVICFATGCALPDPAMEQRICRASFEAPERVSFFYLPGGFDESKLGQGARALVGGLRLMLKHRSNLSEEQQSLLERTSQKGDYTDRELLGPLVSEIEQHLHG